MLRKTYSFGAGLLAKFCFWNGYACWFLPPLMFFILLRCMEKASPKQSFFIGLSFGFGYFVTSLFWIHIPFQYINAEYMGYVAVPALALYLALYPALACYITNKLFPGENSIKLIFFSAAWVLMECARGYAFTGFPWNLIGYAAYDIPYFKQIASVFGIYGVSFIYLLVITLMFRKKTVIYSVSLLAVTLLFGYYQMDIKKSMDDKTQSFSVSIVHPAITQTSKLTPGDFMDNLHTHLELSNLNHSGKRLILWPEVAINTMLSEKLMKYIASYIPHKDTYLIAGIDDMDKDGNIYNSLIVLDNKGIVLQQYDKKHLLPFGEYIPEFLLKIGLRKITSGMQNFSGGTKSRAIKIDGFPELNAIICYEVAFPGEIIENKHTTKCILNITNDAWFKKGFEGSDEIYQHFRTSVLRAIEEGVPIIRSANMGISCIIDARGEVLNKLPEDINGVIDCNFRCDTIQTLYSRCGNIPIFSILLLVILVCVICSQRRHCEKN